MEFNSDGNIRMIWGLVGELCNSKFNMNVNSIPNMQQTFSDRVREFSKKREIPMVERNKMLIAACHSHIQSFMQASNRSSRMAERGDMLNNRMKEAQSEMNGLLQGPRPVEIDFSDKAETSLSSFEINKKVKSIQRERREAPLLKIDHSSQSSLVPKKKVRFKEEEGVKASGFYIDNKISFQGVNRNSIKIHALLLRNRDVDGTLTVLGQRQAMKVSAAPVLFAALYVNNKLENKQICFFNNHQSDDWVRFEPKKPIVAAGAVEKIEFLLFDHMHVPFFLGRTVKNPEKLSNVSVKDADMKEYIYVRVEGVAAGDHLQSENKRVEVLGTCGLCGTDEAGAACAYLNDGGKQNCAILSEDIDLPIVNYGAPPLVYFVA